MYNQLTDKVPMNARPTFTGAIPNNVINQGFKTEPAIPKMDAVTACMTIEGGDATDAEMIQALSYLVKTGMVWSLQGFYGRLATRAIADGILDRDGNII